MKIISSENYSVTTLQNGIKIISEFVPYVKSFSLGFWFNVGARDESPNNNGISHFIEHMLFKGTKHRSAKKISEEIESVGGYLNAFTSKEHTCYYSKGLYENLDKTFRVLSDMIQNPLFKENHIKKEAGVVIDELHDIDDNPEELVFEYFEEEIFKGNTLSLPVIGKEQIIKSFNSSELFKYHNSKYFTGNLLISASGFVKHNELVKLAGKYFNGSKSSAKNYRNKFNPKKVNSKLIEKDIQQVHTIVGRSTIGFNNRKRIQVKLLSAILGEGSSSRLFQAVRERRGITYQINTFLNSYLDVSSFGVYYSTNTQQTEKVMSIIFKEFKNLKEKKIAERELNRVKEYLKGGILLSLESTTNRMMRIANSMLYYNKILTVDEVLKKIDSVSSSDILEIANKVLDEEKFSKIILKSYSSNLAGVN